MKKSLKMFGCMLAVLMFMAWNASAQTNLEYLTSKSKLLVWMVEQAGTATMWGWCNSETEPTMAQGILLPEKHVASDIISFVTNTTMVVKEANLKDSVQLYCSVARRDDGSTLFWGWASGTPTYGKGGYRVDPLEMVLKMNWFPIRFDKPVQYAELWFKDPYTGQTTYKQNLNSWDKEVWFNPDQVGAGYLSVMFTDGTKRVYDLKNQGQIVDGTEVQVQVASARIDNLEIVKDPTQPVSLVVQSNGGVGVNPTFEISMTSSNWVSFNIKTSEGRYPLGLMVKPQGDGEEWQYCPHMEGSMTIQILLEGGTYYAYPVWDPADFREAEPTPEFYNGKG